MEEILNGEQPIEEVSTVQNSNVEEVLESGTSEVTSHEGSLGKFKDAESLLNAYNSLQAEFTRKSQKLSEVTKELEASKEKDKKAPVFASEEWNKSVSEFLEKNAEAKKYSGEIASEIMQDKSLQESPNALELAWARVMQKKYVEPETLASDKDFITEKILSQDEVKKQVLEEYFKNLQKVKTPPVISSNGNVAFSETKQPSSLAEAKQLVEQMFNLKGE